MLRWCLITTAAAASRSSLSSTIIVVATKQTILRRTNVCQRSWITVFNLNKWRIKKSTKTGAWEIFAKLRENKNKSMTMFLKSATKSWAHTQCGVVNKHDLLIPLFPSSAAFSMLIPVIMIALLKFMLHAGFTSEHVMNEGERVRTDETNPLTEGQNTLLYIKSR